MKYIVYYVDYFVLCYFLCGMWKCDEKCRPVLAGGLNNHRVRLKFHTISILDFYESFSPRVLLVEDGWNIRHGVAAAAAAAVAVAAAAAAAASVAVTARSACLEFRVVHTCLRK